MRRLSPLLLSLTLLLTACSFLSGPAPVEKDLTATPEDLAAAALESQSHLPAMSAHRPEDDVFNTVVEGFYHLSPEEITDGVICSASGAEATEVSVLEFANDATAGSAIASLEHYQIDRAGDFAGYVPEQAALVEDGHILQCDMFVVLLFCPDPDAAGAAVLDCMAGELPSKSLDELLSSGSASGDVAVSQDVPPIIYRSQDPDAPEEGTSSGMSASSIPQETLGYSSSYPPLPSASEPESPESTPSQPQQLDPPQQTASQSQTAVESQQTATPQDQQSSSQTQKPASQPGMAPAQPASSQSQQNASTSQPASPNPQQNTTASQSTASQQQQNTPPSQPTTPQPQENSPTSPPAAPSQPAVTQPQQPTEPEPDFADLIPPSDPDPVPEPDPNPDPAPAPDPPPSVPDVYDAAAIKRAWASGDTSGLAPKNLAVYQTCKQVIQERISSGMSVYDKELAIHDWIIQHSEYDEGALDHSSSVAQSPDNDNPYGLMTHGKSICLGYTSTFQLFMDLLNIDCITVHGTAYSATEEHAWNMVRIDGEWYCVDCTWDDPIASFTVSRSMSHKYFNVTSSLLRATDHQWNEGGIPEATATAWAWKG